MSIDKVKILEKIKDLAEQIESIVEEIAGEEKEVKAERVDENVVDLEERKKKKNAAGSGEEKEKRPEKESKGKGVKDHLNPYRRRPGPYEWPYQGDRITPNLPLVPPPGLPDDVIPLYPYPRRPWDGRYYCPYPTRRPWYYPPYQIWC